MLEMLININQTERSYESLKIAAVLVIAEQLLKVMAYIH